jgi:5,10-methylenetetrahydromethanopterin reductase
MIKLSIAFQTDKRLREYAELAELVEHYGFDTLTLYEDLMYQPAWQPLHVVARHTRRIRLGPSIVNPYLRHPAVIAGEFALLNEAASGRAYLGLGRGAFLEALKLPQPMPVTTVRETIQMVRRLLAGDRAPFEGRVYSASEDAFLRWEPPYRQVPLLIGTWGPAMAALAGEMADEVKVGGCWNPDFVPVIKDRIARGACEVGRDPDEIGVVVGAVSVIAESREEAEAIARREVAMYLPVVAALDPTLSEDEQQEIASFQTTCATEDLESAARRLSSRLLHKFACFGTPHDIIEQVEQFEAAGASRVEFGTPHGPDEAAAIRLLGEKVLPRFDR